MKSSTSFSTFAAYLFLTASLSGCVEVRNRANDNPAEPPPASTAQSGSPSTEPTPAPAISNSAPVAAPKPIPPIAIIATSTPDRYFVQLAVPEGATSLHRSLSQSDPSLTKFLPMPLDSGLKLYTDQEVISGSSYVYKFAKVVDGQTQFTRELSVAIPKDLILEPGYTFPTRQQDVKIEGYNRVYLQRYVALLTEGRNITISGKVLIVEEARIYSFHPGTTAPQAQLHGRNGGKIVFNFEKAIGRLTVEMRGENGANGIAGAPYAEAAAPAPSFTFGAVGPNQGCIEPPANPHGQNGSAGRPGTNGGDGGNSGTATFNILDASEFQLSPAIATGGEPGAPGVGGPGQTGGGQGLACGGYPIGTPGAAGPVGTPGNAGRMGQTERICLNSKTPTAYCL